jgi:hypothetical protein
LIKISIKRSVRFQQAGEGAARGREKNRSCNLSREDGKQRGYVSRSQTCPIVAGKELVYQYHGEKEWLLWLRFGEFVTIPEKLRILKRC